PRRPTDRRLGAGTGTPGDVFMQIQFPLHSGQMAGLTGRIVIAAVGVVTAMLSITGVVIWFRKRRARGLKRARRVSWARPLHAETGLQRTDAPIPPILQRD
ncbi:MAG TPA: PepSY-associated TM helix domain-containing protein, partial [Nitrospiria bacterium]|nr:PepSY-associated TM helix domain-containing protein [Nitrospiria bacterium]